jgi:hypothetical protein
MSEQDYERYPSLTVDDVESCYRVLEIVREYFGEEDHSFWNEQDLRRARYFIREFQEEIESDNK